MPSIYEMVTAEDIVAYWQTKYAETENLLGEELFPEQQKLGLDIKWIKGAKGLPIVLKPSIERIPKDNGSRIKERFNGFITSA